MHNNALVNAIPDEVWQVIFRLAVESPRYRLVCTVFDRICSPRVIGSIRMRFRPTYPTNLDDCKCECCGIQEDFKLRKHEARFSQNHSDSLKYTLRPHGRSVAMLSCNIKIENLSVYNDYYNKESVIVLRVFGNRCGWSLSDNCPKIVWVNNRTEMSRTNFVIFCCEFMSKLFPGNSVFDDAMIAGDWNTTYGEYAIYGDNYNKMFGTDYRDTYVYDGEPIGDKVYGFKKEGCRYPNFDPNEDSEYLGDVYRKDQLRLLKKAWQN